MKVIISGFTGAMGNTLVKLIEESFFDIEIVAGVSNKSRGECKFPEYKSFYKIKEKADVIIDFSHHILTKDMVKYASSTKTKVVIATTGHTEDELAKIHNLSKKVAVIYSGNYSLGINVLVELVNKASEFLSGYDIEVIEKHHNNKIDSPSGTAKMLVDAVYNVKDYDRIYGRHGDGKREDREIGIHAVRGGTIVGEHEVIFAGDDEIIEIKHTALSKRMFANGAIKAALWLKDKPAKLYSMKDVLGI